MRLRHPLEVVVWQNEEGGTIGSKLAIGELREADLDKVARSGKTIREGIGLVGGDVSQLATAVTKRGDIACYIELHIEQGGLLEKARPADRRRAGHRRTALVRGDHHRLGQSRRRDADGSASGRHAGRREVHRRRQRRGPTANPDDRWQRSDGW